MLEKLNNQEKLINYKNLGFIGSNKNGYDFTNFISLRELFRAIYYGEILIPAADKEQYYFDKSYELLTIFKPKKDSKYNKLKGDLLINAKNFVMEEKRLLRHLKIKYFD